MQWEMVELGNVVNIISGFAFESKLFNDKEIGLPVIRVRDVGKSKSETYYSGTFKDEFLIDNGDLLIAMDGDFRCAKWIGGKALLNQRVCKIVPQTDKLDKTYLAFFLPKELKSIEDKTPFATVKHLSVKQIRAIQIPLPPLAEQQRLAALLDTADALRRHDRQLLDHYDRLVQSVFLDLFGKKDFSIIPLEEVAEKIQIGPFGSQLHREDYVVGGIPLINPMHIVGGKIKPSEEYSITEKKLKELPRYILSTDDIIMGRRGEMARCALVTEKENGWFCGTGSLYIRPKSLVNPFFLFYVLSSDKTKSYLESESKGSTMSNLNLGILNKLPVILPPLSLQTHFAALVHNIEAQKERVRAQAAQSEALFQGLLQQAFQRTGEL